MSGTNGTSGAGRSPAGATRRHPRRRGLLRAAAAAAAFVAVCTLGVMWLVWSVMGEVGRLEGVFTGLESSARPAAAMQVIGAGEDGDTAAPGTTILVAGTDSRSPVPTTGTDALAPAWQYGAQRSDSLMLVHLTSDRQRAYVVAIPRDAWVDIPGLGHAKVNAAYSLGGPSLMVHTVEQLTDVRIDHVAVVDWHAVVTLVDSLGGLELTFRDTTVARDRVWEPGRYLLSGPEVRDFVSERLSLPNGDFDRIERQQEVLRAIGEELGTRDLLGDPLSTLSSARALARSVSVDEGLGITEMVSLAMSLRSLDVSKVVYLTAPNLGIGWEGDQSVVYLDDDALGGFFAAFESGQLERWLTEHGDSAA